MKLHYDSVSQERNFLAKFLAILFRDFGNILMSKSAQNICLTIGFQAWPAVVQLLVFIYSGIQ